MSTNFIIVVRVVRVLLDTVASLIFQKTHKILYDCSTQRPRAVNDTSNGRHGTLVTFNTLMTSEIS